MSKLNFSLIRSKNPEINNTDNIDEIESLNLCGCGISTIENLELFHHVKELNLSNNRISKLDDLFMLMKNLQILDVSNNSIQSIELKNSIHQIPKSLVSINLSGNPCAVDLEVVMELQDSFPDLVIAIEEEKQSENEECDIVLKCNDEGQEGNVPIDMAGPLKADDILKMIVDRKCKLQNLQPSFNLQYTIQQLNDELDRVLEGNSHRKAKLLEPGFLNNRADVTKKRIDELQEVRTSNGESLFNTVLEKIKTSALERLNDIHAKHVQDLSEGKESNDFPS